jgi:hypothetical protein
MNTIKLNGIHTNVGQVKLQNNKPKTMSNDVENYAFYIHICLCGAILMACQSWQVVLYD